MNYLLNNVASARSFKMYAFIWHIINNYYNLKEKKSIFKKMTHGGLATSAVLPQVPKLTVN